jgi:glycosyltransferase involved in cell wall biosynthesis
MEKLSVALITKNNESCVKRCLQALAWADEIVILDGFSTDKTIEICREFTDKVFQKKFESFPIERDWILGKTSHKWVLAVDADMEFPPEYCAEVREILAGPTADGYLCRSLTIFLGREIRHCTWFEYRYLRLFNKESGAYDVLLSVWDGFRVKTGRIARMRSHFIHHQDETFLEYFAKIKRYSELTAFEYKHKGVRIGAGNALWYLAAKPLFVFLYKYFYKQGFLDGVPGLIVCLNSAISYYSSYAALWDIQRTERSGA